MTGSNARNSERLDRKHLEAINNGLHIGNAIIGVEAATLKSLHRTGRLFNSVKERLIHQPISARQAR